VEGKGLAEGYWLAPVVYDRRADDAENANRGASLALGMEPVEQTGGRRVIISSLVGRFCVVCREEFRSALLQLDS